MTLKAIFTPDHARYDGVRPINIYLLRLIFFLMVVFVATEAWTTILTHQGPWDHVQAVAWCVWATYATMAIFGVLHPLRLLPIMVFTFGYKLLWLIVVAFPLWRAHALAGNPAEEMTHVFMWDWVVIVAVPWSYVWRNYVRWSPKPAVG